MKLINQYDNKVIVVHFTNSKWGWGEIISKSQTFSLDNGCYKKAHTIWWTEFGYLTLEPSIIDSCD